MRPNKSSANSDGSGIGFEQAIVREWEWRLLSDRCAAILSRDCRATGPVACFLLAPTTFFMFLINFGRPCRVVKRVATLMLV